jgi:ABC-type multidrug transport system fused ATPase/permease subunit
MTFLPLGILIIFDAFLITAATVVKIKQRFFRKQKKDKHSFKIPKTGKSLASRLGRNRQYKEIGDPEEAAPFEYDIDYEMEPRSTNLRHRPTGFEQLGAIEDFSHDNHFNKNAEEDRTDLHLFVESLSKCLGNSNFGLSFEFEDLRFQPKNSPKPILSEVSGRINAGSLWGVMGASGAGKCKCPKFAHALLEILTAPATFVDVLMGKTSHTGGVTKVNGVPGNISRYGNPARFHSSPPTISPDIARSLATSLKMTLFCPN